MTADPTGSRRSRSTGRATARGAALATVVETWGSAPAPRGSQLAVSGDGEMMGSVSGGCVEGAVVAEALDALADGAPRLLTYGVSDDEAFAVGLACGGAIRVLVEPIGRRRGWATSSPRSSRRGRRGRPPSTPSAPATGSAGWSRPGDPLWPEAEAALRRRPLGLRRRLVPRRPQPAAAHGGGRRRPHRPGAGADGAARRLRRHRRRSARGLRERRRASPAPRSSTTGPTRRSPPSASTPGRRW